MNEMPGSYVFLQAFYFFPGHKRIINGFFLKGFFLFLFIFPFLGSSALDLKGTTEGLQEYSQLCRRSDFSRRTLSVVSHNFRFMKSSMAGGTVTLTKAQLFALTRSVTLNRGSSAALSPDSSR
jgi:hypothetical protein